MHHRTFQSFFVLVALFLTSMGTITAAEEIRNLEKKKDVLLVAQGYDVVSYLTTQEALPGDKKITVNHNGATYLFASETNKALFLENPQRFEPAYGGWCAYAMADGEKVGIDPKTFTIIDDTTYLFYNGFWGNTLKKWNKEGADTLKAKADSKWQALVDENKSK
jgi:hemin uptake protein HemP